MTLWSFEEKGDINDDRQGDEHMEEDFVEFDEKTNLPIRHLEYVDNPIHNKNIDWLKTGRHLDFTLTDHNSGYLFVNESAEKKQEKGQPGQDNGKIVNLYPFDLLPSVDHSEEYYQFMKESFKDFELLLEDKRYKYYGSNMDNKETNTEETFGVLNLIEDESTEKQMYLRGLIAIYLERLKNLIKSKSIEDEWITNYANCLHVLNLINAIYISDDDETIVLLQNWIQTADIEPDEVTLKAAVDGSEKPYQNSSFWSVYVKKMITRGCFGNLIDDLKASQYHELKEKDRELFELIDDFISLLAGYDPITFSLDLNSFLKWKEVAVGLRESTTYMNVKNQTVLTEIYELLGILSGMKQTIETNSESWYECFMALYLYQLPSKSKVQEYLDISLNVNETKNDPIGEINTWDFICISVIKGRFLSVVSGLETLDKFIATFTAIFMEASGLLKSYQQVISSTDINEHEQQLSSISDSIDSMVTDLSMSLLNDSKFFDVGAGILIKIGDSKTKIILSELLPTYSIKNTEDFEWILSICIKLELFDTMDQIYRIQGELLFERGYLYESLYCLAEARANNKIVDIVWKIFEILLVEGDIYDKTLVEKLQKNEITNPVLRHAVSPLVCLYEIINDESSNITAWFNRCSSLLNFKYLPAIYKSALLLMIYPYLDKNVFSVDQLLEIISIVNKFESSIIKSDARFDMMYNLILETKKKRQCKLKYDWNPESVPSTIADLLKSIRQILASDLSLRFLEDL